MRAWFERVPARDGYRPDIDGLRAVAVLAVLGFHVAPGYVRGGFVGVDIFFVISGFLISSIIIADVKADRFRLSRFYARRVRRIFPALTVVLAASAAAAWLLLPDPDLARFGTHLFASAAFFPNLLFWSESGYFAAPLTNMLLHLWSLGVEEQFYIAWPLLLLGLLAFRRTAALVAALALASLAYSLLASWAAPAEGFYSPLSRAWQLLAGALAALWLPAISARTGNLLSLLGASLVAAGLILIDPTRAFPAPWALLPVGGTLLLIAAGPDELLNRVLAMRGAVGIGLISYPLYLWHWPLIAFAGSLTLGEPPVEWRAAAVLVSFPLAWLTFRFVEQPVRQRRKVRTATLAGLMAMLAAAGLLLSLGWGDGAWRPSPDPRSALIAHYRQLHRDQTSAANDYACSFGDPNRGIQRTSLPPGCATGGGPADWLLWGDSHARALGVGLKGQLPAGVRLTQVTTSGCAPLQRDSRLCRFSDEQALAAISHLRPRLVILAQRSEHDRQDWPDLAARIERAGAQQVVLVGPAPQWQRSLPTIAATRFWPAIPAFSAAELDPRVDAIDARLRHGPLPEGIRYVSLIAGLCPQQGCRVAVPGADPMSLMAVDYGHLSPDGSAFVARTIVVPALVALSSGAAVDRPAESRPAAGEGRRGGRPQA
ncbi:acyltransferase family protein [Sphingosinicella sp. YJ22]|uniref:acyltransferase family protein n=1 Tax=Sphingosinicella sp. YJ22 TaxID=1104780 RepID=UPI00140B6F30|nr:acyltransferase family protein [Sphingosinicella sp. YJ22]